MKGSRGLVPIGTYAGSERNPKRDQVLTLTEVRERYARANAEHLAERSLEEEIAFHESRLTDLRRRQGASATLECLLLGYEESRTTAEIRELAHRVAGLAPSAGNAVLFDLKALFSWALDSGNLPEGIRNPAEPIRAPAKKRKRQLYLSRRELENLLKNLKRLATHYADASLLAILTLQRRQAIVGARFSEFEIAPDGASAS